MMCRLLLSFVVAGALSVTPSMAAGHDDPAANGTGLRSAVATADVAASATPAPAWAVDRPASRPLALSTLYASYAGLAAMDVLSTRRALKAGAYEQNPLVRPAAGNSAALWAIKGASAAGSMYFAERMWKKNRAGAVVLMAVLNGISGAVVARNLRHGR
ncbi:MAG TPA: hypothetical protein VFX12_09560 [Vicinamibacterales bacterium]|nr:hypothetical protein [Vicinamibacterales bacterium]